jgi:hypothetical protein
LSFSVTPWFLQGAHLCSRRKTKRLPSERTGAFAAVLPPSCARSSRMRASASHELGPVTGGIRQSILGSAPVLPATPECCWVVLRCRLPPAAALWKPGFGLLVSVIVVAYSDVLPIIRRMRRRVKVSVDWNPAWMPRARKSPIAPADRAGPR